MDEIKYATLPFGDNVNEISASDLALARAINFVKSLELADSANIVGFLRLTGDVLPTFNTGDEIIVFDVCVETGQKPVYDIRVNERIAVQFKVSDIAIPWVYALRSDFPQAPHMNSMPFRTPKCLCIYERKFDELKLEWRSVEFYQAIRSWLKLTAAGALHQDDQPLEPFLIGEAGFILLPDNLNVFDQLYLYQRSQRENRQINFALSSLKIDTLQQGQPAYLLLRVSFPPRPHGVIGFTPYNLWDLHEIFTSYGLSLQGILRFELIERRSLLQPANSHLLDNKLVLLLSMPKISGTGETETDYFVFLTTDTVRDIGLKLNILVTEVGLLTTAFPVEVINHAAASQSLIFLLSPQFPLKPGIARQLTGLDKRISNHDVPIVLIGAGALGSEVFMQSRKKGFGNWTLVDEDILLPHNLVRNQLQFDYLLLPKVESLAFEAGKLLHGASPTIPIWDNYLHPDKPDEISGSLAKAEVIVDISTSIAVARHLAARTDTQARRISMFLNPSGKDLVILAEDKARNFKLDILEFQYYRSLLYRSELADHYTFPPTGVRYSGGCRDITSRISPEVLSIHGGIATRKLEQMTAVEEPLIGIWQLDEQALTVSSIIESPMPVQTITQNGWEIMVDAFLIGKIQQQRTKRLPNETGGILIGGYDLSRKRIYIVDTILSPADSEEYPNSYIRGIKGIKTALADIANKTANHLVYVGEWHSHPDGHSTSMSDTDKKCFAWLESELTPLGFPALMLIAGENNSFSIHNNEGAR